LLNNAKKLESAILSLVSAVLVLLLPKVLLVMMAMPAHLVMFVMVELVLVLLPSALTLPMPATLEDFAILPLVSALTLQFPMELLAMTETLALQVKLAPTVSAAVEHLPLALATNAATLVFATHKLEPAFLPTKPTDLLVTMVMPAQATMVALTEFALEHDRLAPLELARVPVFAELPAATTQTEQMELLAMTETVAQLATNVKEVSAQEPWLNVTLLRSVNRMMVDAPLLLASTLTELTELLVMMVTAELLLILALLVSVLESLILRTLALLMPVASTNTLLATMMDFLTLVPALATRAGMLLALQPTVLP